MYEDTIQLSDEEREGMLQSVREDIEDYPVIPTFKQEYAIRVSLNHGNLDFIVYTWEYHSEAVRIEEHVAVRPTKPWSYATAGYNIQAQSIEEALGVVRDIVEGERDQHQFIYFRVEAPDMPSPRRSYVDIALEVLKETEQELMKGNTIRREYYDR
ncbi:hypothetical protein ES703_60617 [subsurface metagenome]